MRFCLTLELKEETFPIEYRNVILSYIKNALTRCNGGKYYERFFKDTQQKDYCFSVILPKSKFYKDKILLEKGEIKILFSTDDREKSGFILFSAFIGQKGRPFPMPNGNVMVLKSISQRKREEIRSEKVIFKTSLGSGLCVREHDKEKNSDRYYVYNDEGFKEKLRDVLYNEALNAGFSEEESGKIKAAPVQCRKVVTKQYSRYIDISIGMFEVAASKGILQYFYDAGMGSRKSMSYGMMDVVSQDLI